MRRVLCSALAGLLAPLVLSAPAGADPSSTIAGSGSTWAQPPVAGWIQHLGAAGTTVTYDAAGNSDGKSGFAGATTDFAVTEIPYLGTDDLGTPDTSNGRAYTYVPILADSVGFTYNLVVDGTRVTDLRLSPATIAGIFTGAITDWSDPAITADNNGRALPPIAITPVVHSDGAGVSRAFSSWLADEFPAIWQAYAGQAGPTSYFPTPADGLARAGSSSVMLSVERSGGDGTIAYLEPSYPSKAGFPMAKVANRAGFFVPPAAGNVAVALRRATVDPDHLADLSGVYDATDPRAYQLSSYAYEIVPTGATDPTMTTAKRQSLLDLTAYALCGGQPAGGGYAALPLNLVQEGFAEVRRLGDADAGVDLTDRDASHCDSWTFDPSTLQDTLDQTVPAPPICDSIGAGPCGRTGIAGHAVSCAVHGPVKVCGRLTFFWDSRELGSIVLRDRAGGPDVGVGLKRVVITELRPTPDGLQEVGRTADRGRATWDKKALSLDLESQQAVAGCDVWRLTAMVGVRRHGQVHWTPRRLAQGRDPVACH